MDRQLLQTRLITFGISAIELTNQLKPNTAGDIMARQLSRAGTSPAMNYAESQNAESSKDFVHKLRVTLKELREAMVCLSIIEEAKLCRNIELLSLLKSECNELTAILVSSINTVLRNSRVSSP